MMHDKSMKRLEAGKHADMAAMFRKLAQAAEESGAAECDAKLSWLVDDDTDCAGEYTPQLIFRVRKIGSADC